MFALEQKISSDGPEGQRNQVSTYLFWFLGKLYFNEKKFERKYTTFYQQLKNHENNFCIFLKISAVLWIMMI